MSEENEVVEEIEEEGSIRDLLESEFEDIDTEEVPELAGDFFADKKEEEEEKPVETSPKEKEEATPIAAESPAGEDQTKAPMGFSPEAREEWGATPEKVKQQILKREQEIATAMQGTAEARRTHDTIGSFVGQYQQVLAAEGASNPMEAISGIVQTVSVLRMGSPQQKAQQLAALVDHYGIDINDLDSALASKISGQPMAEQPAAGNYNPDIERIIDERMAPVNQLLNGVQTYHQQQQGQKAAATKQSIAQFAADPSNEFFADVKEDMADIFDLATKRGQQIDLKTAYTKAVALHPEISGIISQRQTTNNITKKRSASSGLSSVNTREPVRVSTGQDLRSDILDAWESGMG